MNLISGCFFITSIFVSKYSGQIVSSDSRKTIQSVVDFSTPSLTDSTIPLFSPFSC